MKKIFILLFFMPALAFGQSKQTVTLTADMDTTIWIRSNNINLCEIDFTDLSANTDSLWVGFSSDRVGFVAASDFPKVCDKDTYEQYINGSWRNRVGVYTTNRWPGLYLAVRFKLVGSSAGDTFDIITDK